METKGELSRSQRILLKNALCGTETRVCLSKDSPTSQPGTIPIYHLKDVDVQEAFRVAAPELEGITKRKNEELFLDGEDKLQDLQCALSNAVAIPIPEVELIDEDRYHRLYPKRYNNDLPSQFPEMIRTIGDASCSDDDEENEYDLDDDDAEFLKSPDMSFMTPTIFEVAVTRLSQLQLTGPSSPKFLKSKEGYPLQSITDPQFGKLFNYWQKKTEEKGRLAWTPSHRKNKISYPVSKSYEAFHYPNHKFIPRQLRSQKESISFKEANDLNLASEDKRKKLEAFRRDMEIECIRSVEKRDKLWQNFEEFNSQYANDQAINDSQGNNEKETEEELSVSEELLSLTLTPSEESPLKKQPRQDSPESTSDAENTIEISSASGSGCAGENTLDDISDEMMEVEDDEVMIVCIKQGEKDSNNKRPVLTPQNADNKKSGERKLPLIPMPKKMANGTTRKHDLRPFVSKRKSIPVSMKFKRGDVSVSPQKASGVRSSARISDPGTSRRFKTLPVIPLCYVQLERLDPSKIRSNRQTI